MDQRYYHVDQKRKIKKRKTLKKQEVQFISTEKNNFQLVNITEKPNNQISRHMFLGKSSKQNDSISHMYRHRFRSLV
ncbi:hypothetical protein L2E82_47307 [Cichorium intybus]|uniref:Uncharacterized protein n=1 Tax=Cichorium intybus TaxID=13427 RepID=A0ACB8YVQ3_CICIN|nr:hypothetical protein L2E82_47307 [Cichorium intybus]